MRIAKILSYILHPIFMPLLGVFIIFNSGIYIAEVPFEFKRFVYAIVFLCTTVLPLMILPALYFFNMLQQITMDERRQRFIPLFFTAICFFLAYYLVVKFSPIQVVNLFLFSSVVVVFVILLISVFWKISIHTSGIGGITALIVVLSMAYSVDLIVYFSLAILLSGIIASARLALQTHSLLQVIAGFVVGFLLVGGLMHQLVI